jgi:tetratricopeptide (TPR) repeat protein
MSPAGVQPVGADPGPKRFALTITVIAVVVVSLAVADRFLAKVESTETRAAARGSYSLGSRLLAQGNSLAAIDPLRNAYALERQNPEYALELVAGLTAAGKTAEAEPLLTDILQREPNDGRANLLAARLKLKAADSAANFEDAQAYYHRAIYGEWREDADSHRNAVRMELVNLLLEKNRKQELLAELIALEAQPSPTPETQRRLAELFLAADAPARAAAIYQALIDKNPKDTEAYEGLGNAELQQGQYRAAHDAYLRAFLRAPNNPTVRAHLQTLNTVIGLDPTLRQLTSAEKYRRSVRVLDMTRQALTECVAKVPVSSGNQQLLKAADAEVNGKSPAHVTNEAAEGVLSLAQQLWRAETACDDGHAPEGNPLALIMKKLAS